MRIPTLGIAFAVAVISASGAYAKDSSTETTVSQATTEAKEKVVCRTERYVGSNIPSRVCKTKGEWEQARIDAKRALNRPPTRRMRDAEPPGAMGGSAPPSGGPPLIGS